jgi:hypothetical protein
VREHQRDYLTEYAAITAVTGRLWARRACMAMTMTATARAVMAGIRLRTVRDMAVFLTGQGSNDWATTSVFDVEAFLAARPAGRPSGLRALRHFFTWAGAARLVLTNPTRGLSARQHFIRDHGLLGSKDGSGGRARVIRRAGGTTRQAGRNAAHRPK